MTTLHKTIEVSFDNLEQMNVCFDQGEAFECDFGEGVTGGDYDGPYNVIPGETAQTLNTANKTLNGNVTVQPVPDNYARMDWRGNTLIIY